MMTKTEVIREMCLITAMVYHSIGDYEWPSDGFCDLCPASKYDEWNFRHAGKTIDYVREAVVEKLKRDGIEIADGFTITGREINAEEPI